MALYKKIALQNALRYHFAVLSLFWFSELEDEISLPANVLSKKIL